MKKWLRKYGVMIAVAVICGICIAVIQIGNRVEADEQAEEEMGGLARYISAERIR